MAVVEDHVHIFLSAPPKYAPGEIMRILKSRSAKVVFKEFTM
jgi:putative transposase